MAGEYKNIYRMYFAWDYDGEASDLNDASGQGWQLVKGGCFHSRFVKEPGVRYRYQLDYRKVDDMARYIETFREQGWEYINSTFNGWHYFRKLYDPALPEEAYEIFTDRESLQELTRRWSRLALALGLILAALAVVFVIRVIKTPTFPSIIQLLTLAVEAAVLIRGGLLMRHPEQEHKKRRRSLAGVFIGVILIGSGLSMILTGFRPGLSTSQQASSVDRPVKDSRWADFKVKYPDNYYLDLEINADKPLTFAVLNEAGDEVFSMKETAVEQDDIRLWLTPGDYCFSISYESGFRISCYLN